MERRGKTERRIQGSLHGPRRLQGDELYKSLLGVFVNGVTISGRGHATWHFYSSKIKD